MASKSKIHRLRSWLCALLDCGPVENTEVVRIPDSNRERFRCDGYDVETEVYSDRLKVSVYIVGELRCSAWFYRTGQGVITNDVTLSECVGYKLRHRIQQYATQRLNEIGNKV